MIYVLTIIRARPDLNLPVHKLFVRFNKMILNTQTTIDALHAYFKLYQKKKYADSGVSVVLTKEVIRLYNFFAKNRVATGTHQKSYFSNG
mgnify:CR=1 FL=1